MLGRAAAQGQDQVGAVQQFGDDLVLEGTEGGLAVLGEDLPDRAARALLDHLVAVGERQPEFRGEQVADVVLPGPHEPDEDDHGPVGLPGRVAPRLFQAGLGRR